VLYGNRRWDEVIFRDALAALLAEHGARFEVRHVLAEPPAGWTGARGLLDRATVARELAALARAPGAETEFFVCGPEGMMAEARAALAEDLRVAPARIHEEKFQSPQARPRGPAAPPRRTSLPLTVSAQGATHAGVAAPGQTVLEAGLAAGAPMPYSCTMGGCGACKVKLAAGTVDLEEPNCLSAQEREAGYVLACVARPVTPVTVAVP
jgi:ferredoxin-NADP reductase